ncbi:hypothetical protein B8A44_09545 [Dolosigranulum pigrum]|uniref:DUF1828 domain-containing protein n=1 Tax=Dolosigranulum pigrum TaxID=29394 RepID=A0A328KG62_9LACT|nr:DUF1828 domain-containing protein [Dolosigranulum pigrum]RAN61395.1 hypothetical protein B8A44_09545 [Dolosigranulum pigrum]
MTDEIISIRKLENTSPHFTVYELLTDRLNHINDHIVIYKVVNNQGQSYLEDDGWTLNELKMYGIKISGSVSERIYELLADHHVYRGFEQDNLYTGICSEDEIGDEVTSLLDVISSIYKEFLE